MDSNLEKLADRLEDCTTGYATILVDKKVDHAVLGMLIVNGWPDGEKEDGLAEVRMRAVRAFHRGVEPPATVDEMKAFCAKIARDLAIDWARRKKLERKWCVGPCEDPDEFVPLQPSGEQRDPVDAARQLEVAAELFREGRMPEGGVDILEGVASKCTYAEVAEDLGVSSPAVQGRLKTMRRVFKKKILDRDMG
jgi:DNA-directed RNA polymerase specialized sigma24 family protein